MASFMQLLIQRYNFSDNNKAKYDINMYFQSLLHFILLKFVIFITLCFKLLLIYFDYEFSESQKLLFFINIKNDSFIFLFFFDIYFGSHNFLFVCSMKNTNNTSTYYIQKKKKKIKFHSFLFLGFVFNRSHCF